MCVTRHRMICFGLPSSLAYGVFVSQLIRYTLLAPFTNVLFRKLYGRYDGPNFSIWRVPLANVELQSEGRPIIVTSQTIKLNINFMTLNPNFTFTELREVFIAFATDVASQQWTFTILSLFGTSICFNCWDIVFWYILRGTIHEKTLVFRGKHGNLLL